MTVRMRYKPCALRNFRAGCIGGRGAAERKEHKKCLFIKSLRR